MARTPKNIRQIGGREDRVKVYLEDYVSTYLRRVQELQEENGVAGVLVGTWQTEEEETANAFIGGALSLRRADLEGGRLYLSQDAWTECYETLGTYFSGQDLCGIFVCEGSCRRFRRQALFAAVREYFPDRDALLYLLTEEGEEIFYRITSRGEARLQGYYCYFERNEAMQEYMMDNLPKHHVEWEAQGHQRERGEAGWMEGWQAGGTQEPQWEGAHVYSGQDTAADPYGRRARMKEGSLGDPVKQFRKKMDRSQKSAGKKGSAREQMAARSAPAEHSGRSIVALCAAMAVVIFVSGLGLVYRERGGVQIEDLLSRLQIDASQLVAVSALPEETGEHYEAGQSGSSVVVEEIAGNVYPTQEDDEADKSQSDESPSDEAQSSAASGDSATTDPVGTSEESDSEDSVDTSGENAVAETPVPTESATEPAGGDDSSESVQESSDTPAESLEASTDSSLPASTGVLYVVKAGDSLYSISRRFYGTDAMVSVIQEMNGLSNADLIKEGQTLLLP